MIEVKTPRMPRHCLGCAKNRADEIIINCNSNMSTVVALCLECQLELAGKLANNMAQAVVQGDEYDPNSISDYKKGAHE